MIGKKAPSFTLLDQNEKKVNLDDFKGKWVVLYFYPKDNTPGCTREAIAFTETNPDFRKLDAEVIGISPDSCGSHQRFIEKHGLGIRLLSDPDKKVLEKYGAFGEKKNYGKVVMGVIRSTVLIDPEGKVAWHWKSVKVDGHAEKVREKLKELRG